MESSWLSKHSLLSSQTRNARYRTLIASHHRRRLTQGNGGDCPGRKLLIGRRPVRNWTRRTTSSLFLCRKLHFFLGKSTKTAATRAARFDSNMHQIVYRLGFAPDATGGAYSAPPDHLAVFRGPTSKGRGGEMSLSLSLSRV